MRKYRLVICWFDILAQENDGTVHPHPLVRIPYPWLVKVESEIRPALEAAAQQVVAVVADEMTPQEWAFETHPRLREAIIDLEDQLDGRRLRQKA